VTLLDTSELCVLKNVVKLSAKTSQFAGTIQNPTTSVSSKKFRLMAGPSRSFLLTKHEYLILPASVVLGILVITIIHTGKSVLNNSISPHHVAQAW
jgi:folate-dependent tRNA-U54 methylase TrmFO/GidA